MCIRDRFCCCNRLSCRVDRSIFGSTSDDFLANCSSSNSHHPFHNCWVVRVAGHSQILGSFKHIRFHLVATWRSVPHNWRNRLWIKKAWPLAKRIWLSWNFPLVCYLRHCLSLCINCFHCSPSCLTLNLDSERSHEVGLNDLDFPIQCWKALFYSRFRWSLKI